MPNYDEATGVRYGVAALDSLADWVWEEFVNSGTDNSYTAYAEDCTGLVGLAACEALSDDDAEAYEADETCYSLDTEGMRLELSWLGGAPLVWVIYSPVRADCGNCSPCCPGAGNLDADHRYTTAGGTYSLPLEWWREGGSNG